MECSLKQWVCAGVCAATFMVCIASSALAASPGTCISDQEAELLGQIDQYRIDNSLPTVPWSKSLTTVAQWHVIDAIQNDDVIFTSLCNQHSWSDTQPELWQAVCYTDNHANAAKMWSKPAEITDGVYPWSGYEISGWGYRSVTDVLNGWRNSPGHNDVILNRGIWTLYPWKAMGVGVDLTHRYYYVWFSTVQDPQGEIPLCAGSGAFNNSFE